MKFKKKYLFVLAAISILMLVSACSRNNDPGLASQDVRPEIELIVTRDYGNEEILKESVVLEKYWTVLDAMDATVEISTDYGGSFISGINGLESNSDGASGKRMDWFYYINGVCADVGPLDYDLNQGDVVWWDYHEWESMDSTNSTVIGSYPEPFVNGYRGVDVETTIMSSEENSSLAQELKEALVEEGAVIEIAEIDNSIIEDRKGPVIVVGQWNELSEVEYISKLNEAYTRNGSYVYYSSQGLEIMNRGNEMVNMFRSEAGSVVSHGDGLGDDNPLWIVSGVDNSGLEQALKLLINKSEEIYCTYSVAIEGDEIIRLPVD